MVCSLVINELWFEDVWNKISHCCCFTSLPHCLQTAAKKSTQAPFQGRGNGLTLCSSMGAVLASHSSPHNILQNTEDLGFQWERQTAKPCNF